MVYEEALYSDAAKVSTVLSAAVAANFLNLLASVYLMSPGQKG